jgi:hypothetical protein
MFAPENTQYRIQGMNATATQAMPGKRFVLLAIMFLTILTLTIV